MLKYLKLMKRACIFKMSKHKLKLEVSSLSFFEQMIFEHINTFLEDKKPG